MFANRWWTDEQESIPTRRYNQVTFSTRPDLSACQERHRYKYSAEAAGNGGKINASVHERLAVEAWDNEGETIRRILHSMA